MFWGVTFPHRVTNAQTWGFSQNSVLQGGAAVPGVCGAPRSEGKQLELCCHRSPVPVPVHAQVCVWAALLSPHCPLGRMFLFWSHLRAALEVCELSSQGKWFKYWYSHFQPVLQRSQPVQDVCVRLSFLSHCCSSLELLPAGISSCPNCRALCLGLLSLGTVCSRWEQTFSVKSKRHSSELWWWEMECKSCWAVCVGVLGFLLVLCFNLCSLLVCNQKSCCVSQGRVSVCVWSDFPGAGIRIPPFPERISALEHSLWTSPWCWRSPQQNLVSGDEQRCSCRAASTFSLCCLKFLQGSAAAANTGLLCCCPARGARSQILHLHHPASPRSCLNHCKIRSQLTRTYQSFK